MGSSRDWEWADSGHCVGGPTDDREPDRRPQPVRRQADSGWRPLPVRRRCRKSRKHRDPVHADSRCGSNIDDHSQCRAFEDAGGEPEPARPVVDQVRLWRPLRDQPGATALSPGPNTRDLAQSSADDSEEDPRAVCRLRGVFTRPRSVRLCHDSGLGRASRHSGGRVSADHGRGEGEWHRFRVPVADALFARDDGLDAAQAQAAEARVRQWREQGCLPFPDFPPEQERQMRGSLVYPPPGSAASARARLSSEAHSSPRDAQTATAEAEPAMHDSRDRSSCSTSAADAGETLKSG